jgi:hypothetical protein
MKYSDIKGLTPAQIQSKYTAGQAVQFELGANIPTGFLGRG